MKKAQSTLEYLIIVCVVVGALITAGVYVQNQIFWFSILNRAVDQTGPPFASVPTKLNKLVPGYSAYGYYGQNGKVSVGPYEKYYFVVDPSIVGNPATVVFLINRLPSNNNLSARIITVDKNGKQINDTGNLSANNAWLTNNNYSYIIELTENQGKTSSIDVCWWWQ